MSEWPTQQDYDAAIGTPTLRHSSVQGFTVRQYSLEEAKARNAIFLRGRPYSDHGAFAVVYQFAQSSNASYVFRVFTKTGSSISNLRTRYAELSKLTKGKSTPWLVDVTWLEQGLLVQGKWRPAVLMERVEGVDLETWLQRNRNDRSRVVSLADQIRQLAREFAQEGIAHGDLSHRNIMVTPIDKLRLVDYDGIYLASLKSNTPSEIGLPGMQHPKRTAKDYGPRMDRFSLLVLYLTLRYLADEPGSMPSKCDDGLILLPAHFTKPGGSPLEAMMRSLDDDVRRLAKAIVDAAQKPVDQVPTLEEALATPAPVRGGPLVGATAAPVPDYLRNEKKTVTLAPGENPRYLKDLGEAKAASLRPANTSNRRGWLTKPIWLWLLAFLTGVGATLGGFSASHSVTTESKAPLPDRKPSDPTPGPGYTLNEFQVIERQDTRLGMAYRLRWKVSGLRAATFCINDEPARRWEVPPIGDTVLFSSRKARLSISPTGAYAPLGTVALEPDYTYAWDNDGTAPQSVRRSEGPALTTPEDIIAMFASTIDYEHPNRANLIEIYIEELIHVADRRTLRIYRNALPAHHGYTFGDPELARIFVSRWWYRPRGVRNKDLPRLFSGYEQKNSAYLYRMENSSSKNVPR